MNPRILSLLALVLVAGLPRLADAADTTKLTLMLDWFLNPDHAPVVIAKQRGYFDDAGLDVKVQEPADPNNPPKLVAAGKADIAVSYQPQLHLQVDAGLPLARIGTLVATPLNTVLALESGPVENIEDLKGRKVGYSVGGFEEVVLGTVLESAGLSREDVDLVNVNFSLSPALLSEKVAAVVGAYRNFELNQLEIEGAKGRAFFPEEHGLPAYDELIFVARNDRLDDPALRRFINAVERGVQYVINHPDESYDLFVEAHPELDDELNRKAWTDTLPRFALRPAALDTARYIEFARFLAARDMIGEVPSIDAYAVELPRIPARQD